MSEQRPRLVVFSSLFPHAGAPNAGLFIRERMFRVGRRLPITVVSPRPWFPGQGLIRRFRPHYRPPAPARELQDGFRVYHPRFLAIPGLFRRLDGLLMALGSYSLLRRIRDEGDLDLLDAHFGYPDGYAATLLGRWLKVPVTITLRGTEVPHSENPRLRPLLVKALGRADRLFSVSDSLRRHAIGLGVDPARIRVVGNGVDTERFRPVDRAEARRRFGLPAEAKVLVSVGGLVERKGFHRVIDCLPRLCRRFPDLHYLVIGGPSAEGDWGGRLREQVARLGLERHVLFLGPVAPEELKYPLCAADVFVLATRNEGWANVFLEAMACGLPVVTTDVGGNREVVARPELGTVVPFGDGEALEQVLGEALDRPWDRARIRAYAEENDWDRRVKILVAEFCNLASPGGGQGAVEEGVRERP